MVACVQVSGAALVTGHDGGPFHRSTFLARMGADMIR
jgi:hypothetical protein